MILIQRDCINMMLVQVKYLDETFKKTRRRLVTAVEFANGAILHKISHHGSRYTICITIYWFCNTFFFFTIKASLQRYNDNIIQYNNILYYNNISPPPQAGIGVSEFPSKIKIYIKKRKGIDLKVFFVCFHQERKGTAKLDFLRKIETDIQKKWEEENAFESDAPVVEAET